MRKGGEGRKNRTVWARGDLVATVIKAVKAGSGRPTSRPGRRSPAPASASWPGEWRRRGRAGEGRMMDADGTGPDRTALH